MKTSDNDVFTGALEHLQILAEHLTGRSLDDRLVLDAVCLRLSAAIEELSRLPADRRTILFGDDWHAMWAVRNRIAHAYLRIDAGLLRRVVDDRVPALTRLLEAALAGKESAGDPNP